MLGENLIKEINKQINEEMYSAYLYLSMSTYFEAKNLKGFANWMRVQYQEEMFHAEKFMTYLYDRGAKVILEKIEKPENAWKDEKEVFNAVLKHEKHVTDRINLLMSIAKQENDYASEVLLHWFIQEQVEEESNAEDIINKLNIMGNSGHGLFMLNNELATRVFTPPQTTAN